ncbi:unnamed protein product [Linum tenue]|uniref:Uncharacterized protein n=1 Tax=Linum tenue TaxID=586396 RepID=A0AAV0IHS9_9ROSI|nr:unnamed protein product [Linum tenue]
MWGNTDNLASLLTWRIVVHSHRLHTFFEQIEQLFGLHSKVLSHGNHQALSHLFQFY